MNWAKVLPLVGVGLLAAVSYLTPDAEPMLKGLSEDDHLAISSPFDPLYSNNEEPRRTAEVLSEIIHLDEFMQDSATDGSGQRIAVIDSGIDVGHPDFVGQDKIACYRDLTREGVIQTSPASHHQEQVYLSGTIYHIGQINNNQAQYRLGTLALRDILLGGEGQFGLLVTAEGETYDTVYVDTNQNNDFTDEQPLKLYQENGGYLALSTARGTVNLLLSDLSVDGVSVQFSGDFLGHGTFIAGLIGANGDYYQGLAPQAQLLVYKIFDRRGTSSQLILARAIEQALADGADVINLSLSLPADETVEPLLLVALEAAQTAQVPIIAAAGNYGSALDSLAFPANQPSVLSAGCYIAPSLQQLELGVYLEKGYIPSYSARGGSQGSLTVVAPGGVSAPVPMWFGERYMYDEGTSAAAAVTAASVSHILEYAKKNEITLDLNAIKNILALSAQDLQMPAADQGYGLLNMGKMVSLIDYQPQQKATVSLVLSECSDLFQKTVTLKSPVVALQNHDSRPHTVRLQSANGDIQSESLLIAPYDTRKVTLKLQNSVSGVHCSTILTATIDEAKQPEILLPVEVIQPYAATKFTGQPLRLITAIPQGQSRYFYFDVASHTDLLQFDLALETIEPQNDYEHQIVMGRCRMRLYDPQGHLAQETPYFGASYGDLQKNEQQLTVNKPAAGVWQLTITSSGQLSVYNHFVSRVVLHVLAQPS